MIKKVMIALLFSIFAISLINASSSDGYFGIEGCGGAILGSCMPGGFVCEEDGPINVRETTCNPSNDCCGQGYECDSDTLNCTLSTIECTIETEESACLLKEGCFWMDVEGDGDYCTEDLSESSCSAYQSKSSCEGDDFNLGKQGEGTEVCGTYTATEWMTIKEDSCECVWTGASSTGNYCSLSYNVTDTYSNGNPWSFNCQKSFTIGECNNGEQIVSWTVSTTGGPTTNQTTAAGCVNGQRNRACGSASVKLPGFSTFALLSAMGILTIFYLFQIKRKEEK